MNNRDKLFKDMYVFVRKWNRSTRRVLEMEIERKDVQDTLQLKKSLAETTVVQGHKIVAELSFLLYGRFVDMGVGRGRGMETREGNTSRLNDNNKKWFNRPYYGRLSTLRGVVGIKVMDSWQQTIKELEK